MTNLNFKQEYADEDPDLIWSGVKTYQLTPWPKECTITYYDFGTDPKVKAGQITRFDWENGSAEYEALEDGLDVRCKLLPGSSWEPPPR